MTYVNMLFLIQIIIIFFFLIYKNLNDVFKKKQIQKIIIQMNLIIIHLNNYFLNMLILIILLK